MERAELGATSLQGCWNTCERHFWIQRVYFYLHKHLYTGRTNKLFGCNQLPLGRGHVGVSDDKTPAPAAGWILDSLWSSLSSLGRHRSIWNNITRDGDKQRQDRLISTFYKTPIYKHKLFACFQSEIIVIWETITTTVNHAIDGKVSWVSEYCDNAGNLDMRQNFFLILIFWDVSCFHW